jgi:hypothetical protein
MRVFKARPFDQARNNAHPSAEGGSELEETGMTSPRSFRRAAGETSRRSGRLILPRTQPLRTPRPWTFGDRGRSPGLRVKASIPTFPRPHASVVQIRTVARRLQLRGQLRHSLSGNSPAHRIPVLAPNPCESEEPRTLDIVVHRKSASIGSVCGRRG